MSIMFRVRAYYGGEILQHPQIGSTYSEGYIVRFQMRDGARFENLIKKIKNEAGFDETQIIRGITYRCPSYLNGDWTYRQVYIANDEDLQYVYQNEKKLGCMQFLEFYVDCVDAQTNVEGCEAGSSSPQHADDEHVDEEHDTDDNEYYTTNEDDYDDDEDDDDENGDDDDAANAYLKQPYCEAITEVGHQFRTKQDVIDAVQDYNIRRRKTYHVIDSSRDKWYAVCKSEESACPWRVCARKIHIPLSWTIVTYVGPHSCTTNDTSLDQPQIRNWVIPETIEEKVKKDVAIQIKVLQEHIRKRYSFFASFRKLWVAKDKVVQQLYGKWDESYNKLPQFTSMLKEKNPGTIVEWEHLQTMSGLEDHIIHDLSADIFSRVFWAFGQCIHAFKFCRPILTVNATIMYGKYRCTCLVASGFDATNHIVPVAFAIVDSENYSSWEWFLQHIRRHITGIRHMTIISDLHNGVCEVMNNGVVWQSGEAVHRYCTQHIAAVVARHFKNNALQDAIEKIAGRFDKRKFSKELEEFQKSYPECASYLSTIDVSQWTAAHDGGHRFGIMTSKFVECLNGILKDARYLPITAAINNTHYKCAMYFYDRTLALSGERSFKFPSSIDKILKHRKHKSRHLPVHDIAQNVLHGHFKVWSRTGNREHIVKLWDGTCTCGKFQGFHIPCSHAIAACREIDVDPLQYVFKFYSMTYLKRTYEKSFYPLGDPTKWPEWEGRRLLPNNALERHIIGRPRPKKYHNKMISRPRPIICGLCGNQGHNRRRCSYRMVLS